MKSNSRFHWIINKQKPVAKLIVLAQVMSLAAVLYAQVSIPAYALHKEAALLENYNSLEDLVRDIRNGKIDFKDFRSSDGISPTVMRDSELYDKIDNSTQKCLDFAGRVGNELGDREIVRCSEDPNYFKSKYAPNSTGVSTSNSTASFAANNSITDTQKDTISTTALPATSISDDSKENKLITALVSSGKMTDEEAQEFVLVHELVRTGKFTESEAKELASRLFQTDNVTASATDGNADDGVSSTAAETKSSTPASASSTNQDNKDDKLPDVKSDNPADYNDLSQLVRDIKNGDLDANIISLKDFQNSGAYKGADAQTQHCIDLGGKIGHNLDDSEIVHCSEDSNYFNDKS